MDYIREWSEGRITLAQICDMQAETTDGEPWEALEVARRHAIEHEEYLSALSEAVHGA
jgi:hypothetical protein